MISLDQIPQLVVHYGCRIPLKTELKPSERESLKTLLQEANQEHFQIFQTDTQNVVNMAGQSPSLFTVLRQYPMKDGAIATAPSLIFAPDSITVISLIKAGDSRFTSSHTIQATEQDRNMREILFKIQGVIKGLRYTRTGKIYELVVGPFSPDKKEAFLKKVIAEPSNDIAEVDLVLTKIQSANEKRLNINTRLSFQQMKLEDPFRVNIKVDINNRDLQTSMEPREIDSIWNTANSMIESHLENLSFQW
ncbi:MAG: hypothetical protein HYZ73_00030 [Elusimicrobia bacterium]|nr:hypothetical protein [Elusimicrobiota bacterium]